MNILNSVISSINGGYLDFNDLKQYQITAGIDKLTPEEVDTARNHFEKRAELMQAIKRGELLPTLQQVQQFEIETADIIAAYNLTEHDYATPQPFINTLRISAGERGLNAELLRYTVMGYDNDQHRHGALVPTTHDTRELLKTLDCYYIQLEANA